METKEKKSFQLPHIYAMLFILVIVCTLLTWILPAGEFTRELNAAGREIAVAGSYHTVEATPVGPFQMFIEIYNGFCDAGGVIFFMFIAYASIGIIISSGVFNGLVAVMLRVFKGKSRLLIIPTFMLLISATASTVGMNEEWFPFIPVFTGIAIALGYDAIVGMSIVVMGGCLGYAGASMNPFTVGLAQSIAEVPAMSGIGYRIFSHLCMLTVACIYVMRYASKIQKDPSASLVYGEKNPHANMSSDDVENVHFGVREILILIVLIAGIIAVVIGCKNYGWFYAELSATFLIMGLVSAIIMGYTPNQIAKQFEKGFTEIAMACMMIGLARGILMILQAGCIIDTIVYYFSLPLSAFPAWISGVAMLVMQTLLNAIVPSGSGQAATSMPIMAPLADLLGLSRDTAVLAFQFGDGMSNMLWPTGLVSIMCGLAGVKLEKWWKFLLPLFGLLFLVQAILMIVAVIIGFGF